MITRVGLSCGVGGMEPMAKGRDRVDADHPKVELPYQPGWDCPTAKWDCFAARVGLPNSYTLTMANDD